LAEQLAEFKAQYEVVSQDIQRVIDNIKEDGCQICCLPITDNDVFIVKCCGLVICCECCMRSNLFSKQSDGQNGSCMRGACPNCKATIKPESDLIFINKKMNLEGMFANLGSVHDISADDIKVTAAAPRRTVSGKLGAMISLIRGEKLAGRKVTNVCIKNIIEGPDYRPLIEPEAGRQKKVIIFANFEESVKNIEEHLRANGIQYHKLHGSNITIDTIVQDFRDSAVINVMVVNSDKICSGLNLQFCDDIIFFHRIIEANTEAQLIGRLQRIGRACSTTVHWLAYENEKEHLE
jgi:SNF2 family DNA or RNA helicase